MIRIKDYIFNESEINYIWESNEEELYVQLKTDVEENVSNCKKIRNATFEDIEWNYVDKVHNDKLEKAYKRVHDELVFITGLQTDCLKTKIEQSCKIQELEEENKRLNSINKIHTNRIQELMRRLEKRTNRINKGENND